jgi:hypothetical protein
MSIIKNTNTTKPYLFGLEKYFSNPVPILSENNVKMICDEIDNTYNYFVEYGLGSSTLYFIDSFQDKSINIISIENDFSWFNTVIKQLVNKFKVHNISQMKHPFTIYQIIEFIIKLREPNTMIPDELSRRLKWKEQLLYGKLNRLSPHSNSKFSLHLLFWRIIKWPLIFLKFTNYCFLRKNRPTVSEFRCKYNNVKILLKNIPPKIKDQFGESPSMEKYINAGLMEIKTQLNNNQDVKAAFIIDGGPRGEILNAIINLEDEYRNFYPTIILCEAHRAFYKSIIGRRPTGNFIKGSNITLNKQIVYDKPKMKNEFIANYWYGKNNITVNELSEREIWIYKSQ